MSEEEIALFLPALRRNLHPDETSDAALTDALLAAEEEILRCLNRKHLPKYAQSLLVELAALKYCAASSGGTKSESYTEGQLSQSESWFSKTELGEAERSLLRTLAPYRRVRCK